MNRFQSWYRMQPAALRALLTINVVLYVLWIVILARIGPVNAFVHAHLALHPELPGILMEPWQLITYNFLHLGRSLGGLLHILFNMLWLVWIGREYEELHGSHRLLALYLITGVGGGLLTVLFYALLPASSPVVVYGASASVLGVVTAVAVTYPYKSIALIFIGTIRLVYLVIAYLILNVLFPGQTAVAAHLGGALFGFLFAKAEANGVDLTSWARIFFRERRRGSHRGAAPRQREEGSMLGRVESWLASRSRQQETKKAPKQAKVTPLRSYTTTVEGEDALEGEVDRILDKISEEGYEALSEEEKQILYRASRR